MRFRKISIFMFTLGALGLLAAGCASEAKDDPCEYVTCSGHGTPRVVGDTCQCQCEEGYTVTADGKSCLPSEGPCKDQTCSGHGSCVPDGEDDAHCECDPGFMQDPNNDLACIEEACLELGVTCTVSTQCCQGFCLKYVGQEEGYCSMRNCNTDDECVDKSGSGNEMCCVDFGGEYFICAKLGSGCTCGDQTGTCGDSCYCTSFSGCDPNYACLGSGPEDTNAICTMPCVTDADCDECSDPSAPDQIFTCQAIYGGETYCRKFNPDTCENSADCEGDEVCIPDVTPDLSSMVGICGRYGAKDPGETCDSDDNPNDLNYDDRCADFYCMRDHCSEVCSLTTDCPEDMVCGVQMFCLQEPCDDDANVAGIGMCVWMEGSLTDCNGNSDCPDGETCNYYITPQDELFKVCVTENCDPDGDACTLPGGVCGEGMDPCWGELCLSSGGDGFCSALCETNEDCPDGMMCGGLGVTETMVTGACIDDMSCASSEDCEGEDICKPFLGADEQSLVGGCDAPDGALPTGSECDDDANPAELPFEETCAGYYCIFGHCTEVCAENLNCPDNMVCGKITFGLPSGGSASIGMCQWMEGTLTECGYDADCPAGEVCMFWVDAEDNVRTNCIVQSCDPAEASCLDAGESDCTVEPNTCYNDLCLTNGMCVGVCSDNAHCPDGMTCQRIGIGGDLSVGACLPFEGSGDPCTSDADCAANGEVCAYVQDLNEVWESICKSPTDPGNDPGEDCPCKNDLCLTAGYCSAVCADNGDCPTGMECNWIGFGNDVFKPACTNLTAGVSPLCSICADSTQCEGDAVCIESTANPGEKYCTLPCPGGDECPQGFTCEDLGGDDMQCKPNGDTCIP